MLQKIFSQISNFSHFQTSSSNGDEVFLTSYCFKTNCCPPSGFPGSWRHYSGLLSSFSLIVSFFPLLSPPPLYSILNKVTPFSFSILLQGQLTSILVPPVIDQVTQFQCSFSPACLKVFLIWYEGCLVHLGGYLSEIEVWSRFG